MNPQQADPAAPAPQNRLDDAVCPDLRTKTMFLGAEWRRQPEAEGVGTAIFWCLHTQLVLGPDDLPVNPRACGSHRDCCTIPKPEV